MGLPSNLSGRSHSSTRSTFIFVLLCLFASFYFIPVSYGPRAVLHLVPNGKEQKKENLSDWTTRVGLKGMHNASLESRLLAWEQAPIVELGDWVQHNLKTCRETIIKNANNDQVKKSNQVWSVLTTKSILSKRKEMIEYLRSLESSDLLQEYGSGKGIVFTAGSEPAFNRVLITLRMLHHQLDSPLPSEIFSFPDERPSPNLQLELEKLNCTLRVLESAKKDLTIQKNYQIKATAIIQSAFREVLYLDSDNIPALSLVGEGNIFDSLAYKRLGAFFWPDYWKTGATNPIWALMGVGCRDEWEVEAGQLVIDKKIHLDVLLLSQWMMEESRFRFWFNFSDGDKDVFRYAMLALRKRYAVPGRYLGAATFRLDAPTGFCGHTMLQYDHLGRPAFVHANLMKQIPSGLTAEYAWGRTKQMSLEFGQGNFTKEVEEYIDDDIDCDMLANADVRGNCIKLAPAVVRNRASLENGISAFFHGGGASTFCIDIKWSDPLKESKVETEVLEMMDWQDDARLNTFEKAFFAEGGESILNVGGKED